MKVLWDAHHPWRKFGQRPEECWSNIGSDVVDVHFKDSFVTDMGRLGYKYCFIVSIFIIIIFLGNYIIFL